MRWWHCRRSPRRKKWGWPWTPHLVDDSGATVSTNDVPYHYLLTLSWCTDIHNTLKHTGRRGTRLYSVIKEKGLPFLTIICVFQRFRGVIEGHQNIWNNPINIQIALTVSHRYTRLSSVTQSRTELLRSFICTTVIQEATRVIQVHFELSTAYLDHSVSQA